MSGLREPGGLALHAKLIASHMDGWTAVPGEAPHADPQANLHGPDGMELLLRCGPTWQVSARNRLVITGLFRDCNNWKPRDTRTHITVSQDREPEAAAREIERRLLPVYGPAFEHATGRAASWRAAEDQRDRMVAVLAHCWGGEARTSRWSHQPDRVAIRTPEFDYDMRAEAKARMDAVDFEVTVPFEYAAETAEFVRGLFDRRWPREDVS